MTKLYSALALVVVIGFGDPVEAAGRLIAVATDLATNGTTELAPINVSGYSEISLLGIVDAAQNNDVVQISVYFLDEAVTALSPGLKVHAGVCALHAPPQGNGVEGCPVFKVAGPFLALVIATGTARTLSLKVWAIK